MKLLADDNIPKTVVNKLKSMGFDIKKASEYSKGLPDDILIEIAVKESRIIITFDKDFGELIFHRKQVPPSIILLEFAPKSAEYILDRIRDLLSSDEEFFGFFTIYDGLSIRKKKL